MEKVDVGMSRENLFGSYVLAKEGPSKKNLSIDKTVQMESKG
jgi:hypothetical protein